MTIQSPYLSKLFRSKSRNKIIKNLVKEIRRQRPAFLVCRGLSGMIPTAIVAHKLELPYLVLRKGKDHSGYRVEGSFRRKKYIIIDDFVSTGATIRFIVRRMAKTFPHCQPKCIVLYNSKRTLDVKCGRLSIPVVTV